MRIRTKFFALVLLISVGFVAVAGLSVRTTLTLKSMRGAIDDGIRLIAQSRRTHGLMKDLVFDLFSPGVYSSLRGIVLSPRSLTTQREWETAVQDFRSAYGLFMANPEIQKLLADEELREAYAVAGPMSVRAFSEMEGLKEVFGRIREEYPEEQELYGRIQSSKDESLIVVFDRVRSSSFYLGNIFESYLNRFVTGLERQASTMERQVVVAYMVSSFLVVIIAVAGVLFLTNSILANLGVVDGAIERLASGDFSSRVSPRGRDEIGLLADKVNLFAGRLKANVDSLTTLLEEVNQAVPDAPDLDRILAIVTDSLLRDGEAECAAVFLAEGGGGGHSAWSGFPPFRPVSTPRPLGIWSFAGAGGDGRLLASCVESGTPFIVQDVAAREFSLEEHGLDPSLRSLILVPLNVRRRVSGVCVFGRRDRAFTDLELTQLVSFADYAALVIDNAVSNAALMAMRDAEYQALQSQIQPHFLYNVLNGLVALNRMGDKSGVELSLHALKDMLRYTLEHERWASVSEEFAFVERYCRLQKLRFEERLAFSLDLEPEASAYRIPKLILQPLVENAVIHGLEPCPSPVRLSVSAWRADGELVLRVEDDGVGCDAQGVDMQEHIGLGNIRERLALLFPSANLTAGGCPGKGFVAKIVIPLSELVLP